MNTVDTDFLIIAIAYSHKLVECGVESYIVKLKMRDEGKFYNILQLRDINCHQKCLALLFYKHL